jgi:hypothetical protein
MPIGVVHWGWVTHSQAGKLFCVLNQTHFLAYKTKKDFIAFHATPMKNAILVIPVWDLIATADVEGIDSLTQFVVKTADRIMLLKTNKANEVLEWLNAIKRLLKNNELAEQRKRLWEEQKKLLVHCYIVEAVDIEDPSCKVFFFLKKG